MFVKSHQSKNFFNIRYWVSSTTSDAPVDQSGYFGFALLHWFTPTVKLVSKNGLDSTLPVLSKYESIKECGRHMQECYNQEFQKDDPKFGRAVFRSVRGMFLMHLMAFLLWGIALG